MSSDLVVPDDVRSSIQQSSLSILETARSLEITNNDERQTAAGILTQIVRPLLKQIDDAYDPNIKRWYDGHKQAIADKKRISAELIQAKQLIDSEIGKYDLEQRRLQREERERIEKAIREEAEKQRVQEAAKLIEQGEEEKAQEILERLPESSGGVIQSLPPMILKSQKAEGVSTRFLQRFRMIDPDKVKIEYRTPDDRLIQGVVDRLGKAAEIEVGEGSIEVYEKASVASSVR